MREQLEHRLTELRAEFDAGQKMLLELEKQQANVRETLLRISGAIQVLEEELNKSNPAIAQAGQVAGNQASPNLQQPA